MGFRNLALYLSVVTSCFSYFVFKIRHTFFKFIIMFGTIYLGPESRSTTKTNIRDLSRIRPMLDFKSTSTTIACIVHSKLFSVIPVSSTPNPLKLTVCNSFKAHSFELLPEYLSITISPLFLINPLVENP